MIMTLRQKSQGYNEVTVFHLQNGKVFAILQMENKQVTQIQRGLNLYTLLSGQNSDQKHELR